jgi:hypothetical protein
MEERSSRFITLYIWMLEEVKNVTLIPQASQLLGSDPISIAFQIIFTVVFVVFIFYGQRIQMYVMLNEVKNSLIRLKYIRDEGRKTTIETIKELGKPATDPTTRVDQFLDYITIPPEGMDPSGIVWKLEHILDVQDTRFKDEVKLMAPQADPTQVNNLENSLEAAMSLNLIYKVIRHYYMLGKKTYSLYVIMQVQMALPLIMREAEALAAALKAFTTGQPIGDGAGQLVTGKMIYGIEQRKVEKDYVVSTIQIEGRTVHVLKAEGPGGNVGKPGEAIKRIIEENDGKIASIITIDAAQKLEGESPGEVAEGIGVAIGGPGVDQFKVEEELVKYKIPINAVVIKEDIGDAVSPMRKEVTDAVDVAIENVKRVIKERTKEGDAVIVAGIGNSIGIGQ